MLDTDQGVVDELTRLIECHKNFRDAQVQWRKEIHNGLSPRQLAKTNEQIETLLNNKLIDALNALTLRKEWNVEHCRLRERLLNSGLVKWSRFEAMFINSKKCPKLFCQTAVDRSYVPPLDCIAALDVQLRESQLGGFLVHLNRAQRQDQEVREHKLELARYEWAHEEGVADRHIFCDNFPRLLERAVEKKVPIDTKLVRGLIQNVRLADCQVTHVTSRTRQLKDVRLMSLTGNWLDEVPGHCLPRSLNSLELYNNLISEVESVVSGAPEALYHLGLGRNLLADDSQLHLLSENLTHLITLDLEDNDIFFLVDVLHVVQPLQHLKELGLQGNPCSNCYSYRETVLKYLPRLLYLDSVEIWDMDREVPTLDSPLDAFAEDGALTVTCYRVMGLPTPSPAKVGKKKMVQTLHFEIELPLLDQELRGTDWPEVEQDDDFELTKVGAGKKGKKEKGKKGKGKKDKGKKEKGKEKKAKGGRDKANGKGSTKSKKGGGKDKKSGKGSKKSSKGSKKRDGPVHNPAELFLGDKDDKTHLGHKSSWFLSERRPFSKLIQFPPLDIPVPDNDLFLIRDTLRSKVVARLVHLKVLPPSKPKKQKAPKGKTPPPTPPPPPTETIMCRTTIAKFALDLRSVAWCDHAQDFSWALNEDWTRPKEATPVEIGKNLWTRVYTAPKGKKKKNKEKSTDAGTSKASTVYATLPLPTLFTCHVGVGPRRVQVPVPAVPRPGPTEERAAVGQVDAQPDRQVTAEIVAEPTGQQVEEKSQEIFTEPR